MYVAHIEIRCGKYRTYYEVVLVAQEKEVLLPFGKENYLFSEEKAEQVARWWADEIGLIVA